ncbi:MAG: twin-arginine translocase TatA/TatE family subunit [Myxococcales bacterium]|nr:twin-arginine translocase TatA/TatE family subunit [Myxococcales bacterium]
MLGLPEMLVILAIVVVLFGATKLPQLGKGMGEAIGNFKKAQRAAIDAQNEEVDATPKLEAQETEAVHTDFEKKNTHA